MILLDKDIAAHAANGSDFAAIECAFSDSDLAIVEVVRARDARNGTRGLEQRAVNDAGFALNSPPTPPA